MTLHLVRMTAITALIVFCTFYPYLPGEFDGLAVALSTMAQIVGLLGVAVAAVGLAWLAHEVRKRAARRRHLPIRARGYRYALASLIASSVVAAGAALGASTSGRALVLLTLALAGYSVRRFMPGLRRLKHAEPDGFNPVPLYLVMIPAATLLAQVTLAVPAMEFSRNRAIDASADLIGDIERYHTAYGGYPKSVSGLWPDYKTAVIGIPQFQYSPTESAYNLFFELPVFLVVSPGTQEIVMYNKLDDHFMLSHASWNVTRSPQGLRNGQGWYAVHDSSRPHWKYFSFD